MNATELKIISTYMELKDLELIGLAMVPEEFLDKAYNSFSELAVSLSNGETVAVIDIDEANRYNELNYIENNFKTLMTFKKENYVIIKLF